MASEWYHTKTRAKFNTWRYVDELREVIELRVTQGMVTLFDATFKDLVLQRKWKAEKHQDRFYAIAEIKGKAIKMHRLLLNVTDPSQIVDHRNGNGLDNRIENITVCTQKQNMNNRRLFKNNKTGENGIHEKPARKRWRVSWDEGGKRKEKLFCYGSRSNTTREAAFEAAKVYRDEVYARIGNTNGIRSE